MARKYMTGIIIKGVYKRKSEILNGGIEASGGYEYGKFVRGNGERRRADAGGPSI
jgi:hypothetical protein